MNTDKSSLNVLAAGSLRKALTPILSQFSQRHHVNINAQFGPAGLLREQIESGAEWDLFASANQEHPQTLLDLGLAHSVMPFLRNKLCLTTHRARITPTTNWLDLLTDPSIIVGTSTPGCDPSGDYTWQLFDRVEHHRSGAGEYLKLNAKQLVGGKGSLQVPATEIASAWLIRQGLADVLSVMHTMRNGYRTMPILQRSPFPTPTIYSPPMRWRCTVTLLSHWQNISCPTAFSSSLSAQDFRGASLHKDRISG